MEGGGFPGPRPGLHGSTPQFSACVSHLVSPHSRVPTLNSPVRPSQPQGSCQSELHRALERLAASQGRTHEDLFVIPIPNCDRNGNFHPKQVRPAPRGPRGLPPIPHLVGGRV